ncbi:MAG TPA: thiamine pyrophosphate-dependent enzyme [Candidatus Humimicrobiaceae bacterium]
MTKEKAILTGNEAIARGAYEAGVKVAAAYPGTPSTEILENIAKYKSIYSQWSVNEKVAMEVASGASLAGARALVAMKHVGLNVAADPFMTLAYTGVNAGFVVVTADDPGMHSSQNEQDNRYYSMMAKIPLLEPSDSQECKDFLKEAFKISEQFDIPVLLRTTTRISHSGSVVDLDDDLEIFEKKPYIKDPKKYVMIPAYAQIRHKNLLERWQKLKDYSNKSSLNLISTPEHCTDAAAGDVNYYNSIGIITSGTCFQFAKESFPGVSILKLGIPNPLPEKLVSDFLKDKDVAVIIEELSPFIQEQVRSMNLGIEIIGKEFFPENGEFSPIVIEALYRKFERLNYFKKGYGQILIETKNSRISPLIGKYEEKTFFDNINAGDNLEEIKKIISGIPPRPPVLCAGCSHRAVFNILKKLKLTVMGDIGCYTLAVLPPLNSIDTTLCMGAGVGQALGVEKAGPAFTGKLVSVIGDSTFFHSGITSLIDNVFNKGTGLVLILDNRVTAMTGHQTNPGIGKTLMGEETTAIMPENIAAAVGVKNIRVINPYDTKKLEKAIKEELARNELSVIICRQECVLINKGKKITGYFINQETCKKCDLCIKFGCPAIEFKSEKYLINKAMCNSCGVCSGICPSKSIKPEEHG